MLPTRDRRREQSPEPNEQHNLLLEYLEYITNSERLEVPKNATEATALYR